MFLHTEKNSNFANPSSIGHFVPHSKIKRSLLSAMGVTRTDEFGNTISIDCVTPPAVQNFIPYSNVTLNSNHGEDQSEFMQAPADYGSRFVSTQSRPAASMPIERQGSRRKYRCKDCSMNFDNKGELQKHVLSHGAKNKKQFKCSHCLKSFTSASYLSQHLRIHLDIKPFGPCQFCDKRFTQLSHLQQHLRTHTGEKPYKCLFPGCKKDFTQLSNLQNHSRFHETDKQFKCNSCYRSFDNEASLLDHIPAHNKSKHLRVHVCLFCGKSYALATYLAKHIVLHNDRLVGAEKNEITSSSVANEKEGLRQTDEPQNGDNFWRTFQEYRVPPNNKHVNVASSVSSGPFDCSPPPYQNFEYPQPCRYASTTPRHTFSADAYSTTDSSVSSTTENDISRLTQLAALAASQSVDNASVAHNSFLHYDCANVDTNAGSFVHPNNHYAPYVSSMDNTRRYADQLEPSFAFHNS